MHTHPFDTLILDNGAKLIFTPCPGTKDVSIENALTTLKEVGTGMVITLMFDEVIAKNQAASLPLECEKLGLDWAQLPISDDAAPGQAFELQWHKYKDQILETLNKAEGVAVHCKGGSGRTGLVIGLILLAYGWPGHKVIEAIQKIKPKALQHPIQLDYFNSYLEQ